MAADGSLLFSTGIDNSGFTQGLGKLTTAAAAAGAAVTAAFTAASAAAVSVGTSFTSAMSQVAATMGITRAAEDYEKLAITAEEYGAKTKYSATQASESLNYLALAGYNAEQAISALPTVLNVAAAGGIDLAYASDMITDSMSALGLEMSELEGFSDALAKTSQKSNTSVAQLGEAILTVGGTAKTLSGGVTELNTMLGLIADSGIKGAEGGTALRNIILSLSAPTDTAAEALESLNVQAFDSEGNMRALSDVFADLNTALAPLTEQQKTEALSDIFNKVDLKAVNALLGTSAERFDELAGYIENCDGAAADMAETMSDNLQGDIDKLSSSLEGLGITVFGKFETPLRKAVQSVSDDISELNEQISEGELSESFDKISEAAGRLVSAVGKLLADDALPAVINIFAGIVEHGNAIISVLAGIAGGIAVFKGITVLAEIESALTRSSMTVAALSAEMGTAGLAAHALTGHLTAAQVAAGVLTGQISLLTAAQTALNTVSAAFPYAAIAAALIAGAAALAGYIDKQREMIGYEGEIKEAYNESNEEIAKRIGLLSELNKTDPYEAYKEAVRGVDETTKQLEDNNKRLGELYNKRQQINIQREHINGFDDPLRMAELNSQLDEADQEIAGIKEQNIFLETALNQRKNIIKQYSTPEGAKRLEGYMYAEDMARKSRQGETNSDVINRIKSSNADLFAAVEESEEALSDAWKKLDHEYAIGVITSEKELYNKKLALLNEYGDKNNEEHWKYYEEIYSYEKAFAEEEADLEEKRQNDRLEKEQAALDKLQEIAEQANQNWLDQMKKTANEEYDILKKSLSNAVNEYSKAVSDLESSRQSYKNRLLSVGDVFSVTETEENGIKTRTFDIADIDKQMTEMRKYHAYVKQLKAEGASEGLLSELTSLDFDEGAQFGQYLTSLSDEDFSKINELYKEREALADELSADLYADEAERLNETLLTVVDNAPGGLPDEAREIGRRILLGILEGADISKDDLSGEISSFSENFGSILSEAIENIDIKNGMQFSVSEGDAYGMGQKIAAGLSGGFSEELKKGLTGTDGTAGIFEQLDAYDAGKDMARDFSQGFNEELQKLIDQTGILQIRTAADLTNGFRTVKETAAGKNGNDKVTVETTNNIVVNLDGEKIYNTTERKREEKERRTGA